MAQWYLSYDGKQMGPMDEGQALAHARKSPNGYAWREGFTAWVHITEVAVLTAATGGGSVAPPPLRGQTRADEIDFKIFGSEMQYVEIELDPGESAVAEAGAMMIHRREPFEMETVFGDASGRGGSSFMDKLVGAGKRLLTGESLFMTVFTHTGQGKGHVTFAAPFPGNIIPIPLQSVGGILFPLPRKRSRGMGS